MPDLHRFGDARAAQEEEKEQQQGHHFLVSGCLFGHSYGDKEQKYLLGLPWEATTTVATDLIGLTGLTGPSITTIILQSTHRPTLQWYTTVWYTTEAMDTDTGDRSERQWNW